MAFTALQTEDQLFALNPGQEVLHSTFGICLVDEIIPEMGVILTPNNYSGNARFEMATAGLDTGRDLLSIPLMVCEPAEISIKDAK